MSLAMALIRRHESPAGVSRVAPPTRDRLQIFAMERAR